MKVLITGGSGFLSRGFLRRVENGQLDWNVTVFSRGELKQDECKRRYPWAKYALGDVRDTDLLAAAMIGHDAVIHAGALKFVPDAEHNSFECISVNVGGSLSVVKAARRAGVERVVGISTDKSVACVNVYGATKMLMERMFAEASTPTTQFNCARYGNVIGSTGSVIPMFKRQYAELGHVKITSPEMTRFWMSIEEAVDLVLAAMFEAAPNAILIPYAKAMPIIDVARAATVDDVEVEIIGERPGEKRHELLLHHEESVRAIRRDKWIELLSVGAGPMVPQESFTIVSNAPHLPMSVEEMRLAIEDAALV